MSRTRKQKKPEGGIPRWFMTYSDVITLLMTFFILLLTFASSEPEGFETMQEALFGSGGSSGTVGTKLEALERDSYVVRTKPASSRLTTHGSEMPPMNSDPVTEAASKGLQALAENNDLVHYERFSFNVSASLYIDPNGEMTEIAKRHLQMLANQMKILPLELTLSVGAEEHLPAITQFAEFLSSNFGVPPGRVGIALLDNNSLSPQSLRMSLRQQKQ